jgi:2'-5' RNA ligase
VGAIVPDYTQLFEEKWQQFAQLRYTVDSLRDDQRGIRRWLLLPYIAFIIPIDDPAVVEQLQAWQNLLHPWLPYAPQPAERLHITLNYVGGLRRLAWLVLPYTWSRLMLPQLVKRTRHIFDEFEPFTVHLGPLNAFPNVLLTEVQDTERCLRLLRARIRRALPLRARPPSPWTYLPHVTLGYWGHQSAAPLVEALKPYRAVEPIPFTISHIKFTVYTRDTLLHSNILSDAREDVIANFYLDDQTESGMLGPCR